MGPSPGKAHRRGGRAEGRWARGAALLGRRRRGELGASGRTLHAHLAPSAATIVQEIGTHLRSGRMCAEQTKSDQAACGRQGDGAPQWQGVSTDHGHGVVRRWLGARLVSGQTGVVGDNSMMTVVQSATCSSATGDDDDSAAADFLERCQRNGQIRSGQLLSATDGPLQAESGVLQGWRGKEESCIALSTDVTTS